MAVAQAAQHCAGLCHSISLGMTGWNALQSAGLVIQKPPHRGFWHSRIRRAVPPRKPTCQPQKCERLVQAVAGSAAGSHPIRQLAADRD